MTPAPDPFFDRVSRLLPDADIVIVPAHDQPGPPPSAEDAQRAADHALALVRAALRHWWPVAAPALEPPGTYDLRWLAGSGVGEVTAQARARVALPFGDPRDRVELARRELDAHGLAARPVAPAGRRLVAHDDSDRLRLEVAAIEKAQCWEVLARSTSIPVGGLADTLVTTPVRSFSWVSSR